MSAMPRKVAKKQRKQPAARRLESSSSQRPTGYGQFVYKTNYHGAEVVPATGKIEGSVTYALAGSLIETKGRSKRSPAEERDIFGEFYLYPQPTTVKKVGPKTFVRTEKNVSEKGPRADGLHHTEYSSSQFGKAIPADPDSTQRVKSSKLGEFGVLHLKKLVGDHK
ncbi:hypothetical protein [Paraburkholderia strydomiana]|uniref:hypothetical protein n=1 Tax=Paraburkholderia strydomiana TaxID=1245417 RepID=UPI001BEBB8B1|nr:hypothetical protein [Paraburkholderia strydomiana]MBT2794782.1 hypothetical protein [Paraburkholderia strydomiana]